MLEMAGNGWEVNRQKRNYCFTANCDHLRDIFTSPYIDKVVWDTSVCTGITSPDAFQTLLDDTFGDHLVTNNTASATFNTSGGGFSFRAGGTTSDNDTIFTVKNMKIPKTVKISYSYNIRNMNRTRLRFTTSTSAYNVWILLDAHNTSAVGKTDCVYTNNNATVLRSWGGGASGNIAYTDTIDVATQCPNCFTDGETVCDFSLTSVLTYAGYATNPCYIKSLEIYC